MIKLVTTGQWAASEVFGLQSSMLGDSDQHPRAYLVLIVKGELVVWPIWSTK